MARAGASGAIENSPLLYNDAWNLKGYRNASIFAPAWYIFTSNGLALDIEGFIPDFFPKAKLVDESIFQTPKSISTAIGESWCLFGKKLDGGVLIVGSQTAGDTNALNEELEENASRFGPTLRQAENTGPRNIDVDIDYAVFTDSGRLVADCGGIPFEIDPEFFQKFSSGFTKIKADGKSYVIFSTSIYDSRHNQVGTILIPKDVTLVEATLLTQTSFSFWIVAVLWVLVVLLSIPFVHIALRRQQRLSALKDSLRNQKLEESHTIEFKPAFQWDFKEQRQNKDLHLHLLKTVAAFLNSDGGNLLMGVGNDGKICGLDEDMKLFKGSVDRFELEVMQLLTAKLGHSCSRFIRIHFDRPLEKIVCIVDVAPASRPTFTKWKDEFLFFVRIGNKSDRLNPEATQDYITTRWN